MRSKKYNNNVAKYDMYKEYSLEEAVEILNSFEKVKFDESIDISINLGVDPRHASYTWRAKYIKIIRFC